MSHWVGFGFQAPSMPLPIASPPLPLRKLLFQPRPMLFDAGGFGYRTDQGRITGAVGFAESVPTGDERDGLFVVHRHARKGLANVTAGGDRIRVAVRAFRVYVDQPHLHGGERIFRDRGRRRNGSWACRS